MRFAIGMAGLTGREDDLVATLAGGWKQRLALGCAILHRPPMLFLDEPTSGVEPKSRRRFWDLIHTLAADGVTVLVSTHYMDEAEYCHRVALINQGRIIAIGSPDELKRTALGGELLLLECDALGPTLAAFQQCAGRARLLASSATRCMCLSATPSEASPSCRHFLSKKAAADVASQRIHPSLEDVFVQLIAVDMAKRRPAA